MEIVAHNVTAPRRRVDLDDTAEAHGGEVLNRQVSERPKQRGLVLFNSLLDERLRVGLVGVVILQLVEVLTSSDTSGLPPLHLAAQEGCYEATRIILYYAARFDILEALLLARDNRQHIALHHAIRNGQKEVFRLLHGARIKGHTSPCTH